MTDKNKPIDIPKKDGRTRTTSGGYSSNDEQGTSSGPGKR